MGCTFTHFFRSIESENVNPKQNKVYVSSDANFEPSDSIKSYNSKKYMSVTSKYEKVQ